MVGRQVRSVRALTGGASTVVDVGVHAMEQSTKELNVTATAGPQRVGLLEPARRDRRRGRRRHCGT